MNAVLDLDTDLEFSVFEGISDEDAAKVEWLLESYAQMVSVMKSYEYAKAQKINGMSLYDMANAEGRGKREHAQEGHADSTANTVILQQKREAIYKFYCYMSRVIQNTIESQYDLHQKTIGQLLYIKSVRYLKALEYMSRGYNKDVYPISGTTFAFKRRQLIENCTNSFKLNGALGFVVRKEGAGRKKEEFGFVLPNWTEYQ